MESENKISKFKELYHSNPEYKKKHLDYVKKKVYCHECGVFVSRCNLGHHKATKKHQNFLFFNNTDPLFRINCST